MDINRIEMEFIKIKNDFYIKNKQLNNGYEVNYLNIDNKSLSVWITDGTVNIIAIYEIDTGFKIILSDKKYDDISVLYNGKLDYKMINNYFNMFINNRGNINY